MSTAPHALHRAKSACVLLAMISALIPSLACAQAPSNFDKVLADSEIKELLIWNSPWDSKSTQPGEHYSFRTSFAMRRGELFAQVTRYSTNESGDSLVTIREGRAQWQDSSGSDVSVTVDKVGDLVGTAKSKTTNYSVIFKSRP